ncbi:Spectrin beta chain, partial [Schistosoma japonicum]
KTLKLVQEKFDQLSKSIGKNVQSNCKQLALLSAFEHDVQALEPLYACTIPMSSRFSTNGNRIYGIILVNYANQCLIYYKSPSPPF